MTDKERLKIILDNSIYDHNFEEFTVPLKDMDWLINQAERVEELEENCSHLRKSFQRQRSKAIEGWEKVIELEKENDQAMTRVHQLASIAMDQKQKYKDLREEKRLVKGENRSNARDAEYFQQENIRLKVIIGRLNHRLGGE